MISRLTIDCTPEEGIALRVIGLIERRGFRLRRLGLTEDEGAATTSIMVDVVARDPGRKIDVLHEQLKRLVGVRTVTEALAPVRDGRIG